MEAVRTPHSALRTPLRPRDIGGILDQAVVVYRRNFVTFLGIGALIQVPVNLILALGSTWLLNPANITAPQSPGFFAGPAAIDQYNQALALWLSNFLSRALLYLLIWILGNVLLSIAAGALARAIAEGYMGRQTSIVGAYRAIRRRIPTLIGMALFQAIASLTIIIPPVFAWLFINWSFTSQAIVLEDAGVGTALQRSWDLARGSWWRIFGAYLLLLVLRLITSSPASLVQTLLGLAGAPWEMQNIGSEFVALLIGVVFVPFQLTAMTLLYFDLRVRREGFDLGTALDERAGQLGLVPGIYGGWPYAAPAERAEG
ncbi:MAG: hypothetical protein ACR2M0_14725 [Chloroflexia bacterium]